MAKKRKNLAKNKPVTPPNMSFEEKVKLKSTGKLKAKTTEKKPVLAPDSHVQYVKPRVKTPVNDRIRNK